jgi:hypothetical protein
MEDLTEEILLKNVVEKGPQNRFEIRHSNEFHIILENS